MGSDPVVFCGIKAKVAVDGKAAPLGRVGVHGKVATAKYKGGKCSSHVYTSKCKAGKGCYA